MHELDRPRRQQIEEVLSVGGGAGLGPHVEDLARVDFVEEERDAAPLSVLHEGANAGAGGVALQVRQHGP